jgi:hypothetical protein
MSLGMDARFLGLVGRRRWGIISSHLPGHLSDECECGGVLQRAHAAGQRTVHLG